MQPSRKIKTILFLVLLLAVIAVLVLASENPQPRPPIPRDARHRGLTDWKDCMPCHDAEGMHPLKPSHPLKDDLCFRCHDFESAKGENP